MIQITLDKEKQDICEAAFLKIMESRLPFCRFEIYGEKREAEDAISANKKREIEGARIVLWNYPNPDKPEKLFCISSKFQVQ